MDEINYQDKDRTVFFTVFDIFFSVFALIWFFFPLFQIVSDFYPPYRLPFFWKKVVFNINLLDWRSVLAFFVTIYENYIYLIYLIPFVSIFKFISFFLREKSKFFFKSNSFFSISLNILSSSLMLVTYFNYVLLYAKNIHFFLSFQIINYISFGLVLFFNLFFVFVFIRFLNRLSKNYREYLALLQQIRKTKDKKKETIVSIRLKLIFSFMFIFIVILAVLSYVLMKDYKKTILSSIENNGKLLSDQSATFFKENFNDDININFYLVKQAQKNENSFLPFESLSFYKRVSKDGDFTVYNSTEKAIVNKVILSNELTKFNENDKIYDSENKSYYFISQIKMQDKIIGYSVVQYKEDVIYKSYFKTQLRMMIIVFIFSYLAVILVYIIGSRIALPIIFLRMNVKKLSATLAKILAGQEKISSGTLAFNDLKIKSKDEIRSLCLEINDLVGVIKGIIPYVSVSTLKNADKSGAKTVKKELAFLFTDIRGFTQMCEGLSPDEVVAILNSYLDLQAGIIMENGGDIDKFVGDEIMATFDGADKEVKACSAALKLIEAMEKERISRENKGLKTVKIGIGINSGQVIFGSVGAKDRMDFTSIGDTVNLAARLEGANKEYQTHSLITEVVYDKVSKHFLCREIDIITVKGKKKPVRIFELIADKKSAKDKEFEFVKKFEEALELYRNMKWKEAYKLFGDVNKKYMDETSIVFMNRIELFSKNPPPDDWDGVFRMTGK